jgi:germacradienol/geosmin synthase
MLPFKLPDFYMPYPARVNPHLEGARAHSKVWARTVGILGTDGAATGEVVWSEQKFDAMDFALFTAHTHPDTPSVELELLTEWYVWGWYVDDFVAKTYEQSRDLGAARGFLARLPAFMPDDLTAAVPGPENAMERALADMWPRTAPTMSTAWRRRYVEHVATMADAGLRDIFLSTLGEPRYLDPVEYVRTRRVTSGMMWSADLRELSLGAEIPPHIYDARPIRVINEILHDSVALRNDIISYARDEKEGKINNAVMVMREFLGCDLQRAANVVNDMVSSRLFQFENTCVVELPLFFDEHQIDPATRSSVLRYVRGCRTGWLVISSGRRGRAAATCRRSRSPRRTDSPAPPASALASSSCGFSGRCQGSIGSGATHTRRTRTWSRASPTSTCRIPRE